MNGLGVPGNDAWLRRCRVRGVVVVVLGLDSRDLVVAAILVLI
jgi:hypothetical protein